MSASLLYSFWNVDYWEQLSLYPLKSINRMESEFVSLCSYNLFVSADLYTQYYIAVREITNPIYTAPGEKSFNRFADAQPQVQRV